jgi:membrane-bound lytic murein transglycosylase D
MFFPDLSVEAQVPMVFAAEVSGAPDRPVSDNLVRIVDSREMPEGLPDLMHASQSRYLEGAGLMSKGEADKARDQFDEAVNLLLRSKWAVASTPALKEFFQDLIQRIAEDESSYFQTLRDDESGAESDSVDELENLDLIPVEVDPALRDSVTSDLAESRYEIPIAINERVMKALDYWLHRGRKRFADGLIRSGRYRPMIEEIFSEESIPLDLIYLAQVESHFKPLAVSKAQARGIWQFKKSTAIRYGLKVTRDVDERSDPEKSTRAAARYLKDLYAMFNDWNLVLAAYNCGEGKVQRLINSSGLQDFWQLVDLKRKLPAETKNHVSLIQACVIIGRNPGKYGFSAELDPPLEYVEIPVSKPINLRAAAKVLGTSVSELKKLNPALKGATTPANYSNYALKVPYGEAPAVREKLAALPRATIKPPPGFEGRHKIQPGETLSGIAAFYNVSISKLEEVNNLLSRNKIRAGNWLAVPAQTAVDNKSAVSKISLAPASLMIVAAEKSGNKKGKTLVTENRPSPTAHSSER